jgi:hypothetical protein
LTSDEVDNLAAALDTMLTTVTLARAEERSAHSHAQLRERHDKGSPGCWRGLHRRVDREQIAESLEITFVETASEPGDRRFDRPPIHQRFKVRHVSSPR